MKKYFLSLIFGGALVLPFAQVAQGVPTVRQVQVLFQAIQGGNHNTINLFSQLFPTNCPQSMLNNLLARAIVHNHNDLIEFFRTQGANIASFDEARLLLALFHADSQFTSEEETINNFFNNEPEEEHIDLTIPHVPHLFESYLP